MKLGWRDDENESVVAAELSWSVGAETDLMSSAVVLVTTATSGVKSEKINARQQILKNKYWGGLRLLFF